MTTEDENHQSIIRTSPRRLAKGMAILVVVMAVGAAIAVPNWTAMVKHPPLATTIQTEEPSPAGVSEGEGLPAAEETVTPVPAGAMKITIPEGASVQGNPDYDPEDLVVKDSEGIIWINQDNVPHTVTSKKDDGKSFDSSIIMSNANYTLLLSDLKEKEYDYFCTIHPYMIGKFTIQS